MQGILILIPKRAIEFTILKNLTTSTDRYNNTLFTYILSCYYILLKLHVRIHMIHLPATFDRWLYLLEAYIHHTRFRYNISRAILKY